MIKYLRFKTCIFLPILLTFTGKLFSQDGNISKLHIKDIMQGDDFVGHLPSSIVWSAKSDKLYFSWNPSNFKSDSLFCYQLANKKIEQLKSDSIVWIPTSDWVYSMDKTKVVFEKNGDIFLLYPDNGKLFHITKTKKREYNPYFAFNESKIAYYEDENIFCWDISTGFIEQITDFVEGFEIKNTSQPANDKDKWLEDDQLRLFSVLRKQEEKRKNSNEKNTIENRDKQFIIYMNGMDLAKSKISPDGNYVVYMLSKQQNAKGTIVPNYVTKSGYTENISARSKVGELPTESKMLIYNILKSKTYEIDFSKLEGINDLPAYLMDYPNNNYQNKNRIGNIEGPFWNSDGTQAFIDIRANDNKDRWLALINFETGELKMLDRQHDDAWIDGPGIGYFSDYNISMGWMPDNSRIWFQSEESGYAHLYVLETKTGKKNALTNGPYEIYNPVISNDKKYWYFSSNEKHPGVVNFYRMPLEGGKAQQLTNMVGYNEVVLSPDESKLAIRYSFSNKPWEIYLMNNPAITGENEKAEQITFSTTKKFNNYNWRVPQIITIKAKDGNNIYARLYKPKDEGKNKAAIIFVHGAGYLQNAHQWWSNYFREYMFHNLLVDNGYTVLDIDYRGSAGYGHDWRTGVYRHMGGKDLSDQVEGAIYLVKNLGIDKNKIGIYGGSYGGFITLMAMFKESGTFKAGAAIRSVADWAHYNDSYTSNILNAPLNDSIAYYQSSPIYYANGLKGHLLMLHGMVDDNVHFQDVVRLSQKLIELGKENWDLAVYPVERHAFTEPSSWTDEYTRIFKFFKNNLFDK